MAIKFFNYTAKFSQVIAFIIPKTFRKNIQNKLDLNFHLLSDIDIPMKPCSLLKKMKNVVFKYGKKKIINVRKFLNLLLILTGSL